MHLQSLCGTSDRSSWTVTSPASNTHLRIYSTLVETILRAALSSESFEIQTDLLFIYLFYFFIPWDMDLNLRSKRTHRHNPAAKVRLLHQGTLLWFADYLDAEIFCIFHLKLLGFKTLLLSSHFTGATFSCTIILTSELITGHERDPFSQTSLSDTKAFLVGVCVPGIFNAQESKTKRFWHEIELVPVPSFHKFRIKHKIMQRWWSSEGSGAVLPSMDPVNLILHFLPLCTCCDGLLLILQWKLCFQRDPVGPRRVFWNNTKKNHTYVWIESACHITFFWTVESSVF